MVRLAKGADILLHEATGASKGHSSALQAVDIFNEAGAKQLYRIHYSARDVKLEQMMETVHAKSPCPVYLAHDLVRIDL